MCQGVDAVFSFNADGLETWCVVQDEKSYQRFLDLLEPFRSRYQIDVYATRPVAAKKLPDDSDPPPSLWNNEEIRAYLQDSMGRSVSPPAMTGQAARIEHQETLYLKQRLILYADQILEWQRRMAQYAADLPALARAALGPEMSSGRRVRAAAICLSHVQGIDRHAQKLMENLTQALPRSAKKPPSPEPRARPGERGRTLEERSLELAVATHSVGRKIYRFIYPRSHTVELVDLREPGLLESLRALRRMAEDYRRLAAK